MKTAKTTYTIGKDRKDALNREYSWGTKENLRSFLKRQQTFGCYVGWKVFKLTTTATEVK